MTSPLPRKPRIILRRIPAATLFSLALSALITAGAARAQSPRGTPQQYRPPVVAVEPPPTVTLLSQPEIILARAQTEQKPDDKKDEKKPEAGQEKSWEDKHKENREKYVRFPNRDLVFAFPNDDILEKAIIERLRLDKAADGLTKEAIDKIYPPGQNFPRIPPVGGGVAYVPKPIDYPPMRINIEPLYVMHRRLHFEEKNSERYGWDLGIIQPFVSSAFFFKDVLLWPNSLASGVAYGFWDTNAGKCLPGSPTPYMLYPPGLTITGSVVEGLVVTGVAFAVP